MAIALVQTQKITNASASPGTVALASTGAGNTLIVAVIYNNTTATPITSITDGGDTFTQIQTANINGFTLQLWYAPNIAARTTPTLSVNFVAASGNISAICREYSGLAAAPLDKSANISAGAASTSASTGTTTATTQANELIVGAFGDVGASQVYTAGSGYGNITSIINATSKNVAMEDKIVAATGTQAGTATLSVSALWSGEIATFKDANAGGSTSHLLMNMGMGK